MMRHIYGESAMCCGMLLFLCTLPVHLNSQTITLERPRPREFVIDRANMLDPGDKTFIQETCDNLLADQTIPLLVVTIESMGQYSSHSMTIEQFAGALYNQWGIGYLKKDGKPWNKGILLLVSRDDRNARIELGAGYSHAQDAECNKIMQRQIVRRFWTAKFSAGIRSGVKALDVMARETEGEVSTSSMIVRFALFFIMFALAIFTLTSIIRTGRRGLAWMMWGALFSYPVSFFSNLGSGYRGEKKDESGWGGGLGGGGLFSGGSFGGGFSGGGGATGSW